MKDKAAGDDLKSLWQNQQVQPKAFSLDEVRKKAARFERKIQVRNRLESMTGVGVILVFLYYLYRFPYFWARVGCWLCLAGLLLVIYRLNSKAAAGRMPEDAGLESCISFHRGELERQRDLLRTVWRWYLGPLVPGILVFCAAIIAPHVRHPADWWRAAPFLLIMVLWFLITGWINGRAANKLQARIEELDRMEK